MKSFRMLAVLLGAAVLAACGDRNAAQNISAPTAGGAVKFFNFGVGAPTVNFYANDQKLTAASSTACSSAVDGKTTDATCLGTGKESTNGTGYGGGANGGGLYSSIAPGNYTLSGHITTTADNGVAISSTPATIDNGKFYSYFLSGIYNTTAKQVDAFVVEDPIPDPDYTKAYVRFVNAISNSQPMGLYAHDQTAGTDWGFGGAIAYKSAGAFFAIPPGIYDLSTRLTATSPNIVTRTGVAFGAGRAYTITAYGDINATTGTSKPALDNTTNR